MTHSRRKMSHLFVYGHLLSLRKSILARMAMSELLIYAAMVMFIIGTFQSWWSYSLQPLMSNCLFFLWGRMLKTKPKLNTQLDIINYLSFHLYIISLLHLASMLNFSLFVHAYYLTFTYHLCYSFYHFHFSLLLELFMSKFIKPQPITVYN